MKKWLIGIIAVGLLGTGLAIALADGQDTTAKTDAAKPACHATMAAPVTADQTAPAAEAKACKGKEGCAAKKGCDTCKGCADGCAKCEGCKDGKCADCCKDGKCATCGDKATQSVDGNKDGKCTADCCKDGKCADCCKDGNCADCCKDGQCTKCGKDAAKGHCAKDDAAKTDAHCGTGGCATK